MQSHNFCEGLSENSKKLWRGLCLEFDRQNDLIQTLEDQLRATVKTGNKFLLPNFGEPLGAG